LKGMHFRSLICSNLLEHVVNPGEIAAAATAAIAIGGLLLVSVPYRFPYHADPIDTMFRPSPVELAELFPGTRIVEQQILSGGNLTTYALGRLFGSPGQFARDLFRKKTGRQASGVRSQVSGVRTDGHQNAPRSRLHLLRWLLRGFKVSCLV